jgi:tRNA (mo5U34)-methyltransferase
VLRWFHSIELAPGVVTDGVKSAAHLERELESLRLPDLRGKSVLDIGAYDGFYSFAAERRGASPVIALDYYVWSTDMTAWIKDWEDSARTGAHLPPPHESRHWRPDELPGRRAFDTAHAALRSNVVPCVGDFTTMDLAPLGRFDVVLYLGVLYHAEDPLRALRRVAEVTASGGLAVIESEAIEVVGLDDTPLCEFFPGRELNNDPTNWWAPNARALEGLCRAAGFREVTIFDRPRFALKSRVAAVLRHAVAQARPARTNSGRARRRRPVLRYRAVAHARR